MNVLIIAIIVGVIVLVFALYKASLIGKQDKGSGRMKGITGHIHDKAMVFLKREYQSFTTFVIVLFITLDIGISFKTTICFLIGALFSVCTGYIGMNVTTKANIRTADAAHQHGMGKALDITLSGGAAMGLCVVGFGVIGISILYYIFRDANVIAGLSLRASSIALFAWAGGGTYAKAANAGADPVGKVEAGIPGNSPGSPTVTADNIGDNVGDIAGTGVDLFESYAGALLPVITLGVVSHTEAGVSYGIAIAAVGILTSVVSMLFVRGDKNPQKALNMRTYITSIITIITPAILANHFFGNLKFFVPIIIRVCVGLIISKITEYYTSDQYKPVCHIAEESVTRDSINTIVSLSVEMMSTAGPIIVLAIGVTLAYNLFGGSIEAIDSLHGIALTVVGVLVTTASTIAVNTYGPIADNAGEIAEMCELPEEICEITDSLNSVGNTTAAIGKGFAVESAAPTTLFLFVSCTQTIGLTGIDISKPAVIAGTFIGGILPFAFSVLTMSAVGNTAGAMIDEACRQSREILGIMEGKAEPEYAKCVDISAGAALEEMIVPGMIAVTVLILVGILIGTEAPGGLQVGALITGVLMAVFMSNADGAWDNAGKCVEGGAHRGKGTVTHRAVVTGDTVGDPFRDTSGPSLNILIKLITVVSPVFAPLSISFGGIPL